MGVETIENCVLAIISVSKCSSVLPYFQVVELCIVALPTESTNSDVIIWGTACY